tara:strand:+ start:1205 stop:2041 length:837 start_codon:yes stop_codon:yes gene_type:complete
MSRPIPRAILERQLDTAMQNNNTKRINSIMKRLQSGATERNLAKPTSPIKKPRGPIREPRRPMPPRNRKQRKRRLPKDIGTLTGGKIPGVPRDAPRSPRVVKGVVDPRKIRRTPRGTPRGEAILDMPRQRVAKRATQDVPRQRVAKRISPRKMQQLRKLQMRGMEQAARSKPGDKKRFELAMKKAVAAANKRRGSSLKTSKSLAMKKHQEALKKFKASQTAARNQRAKRGGELMKQQPKIDMRKMFIKAQRDKRGSKKGGTIKSPKRGGIAKSLNRFV